METTIGLVIQFTGVFLITVLSLFLHRSLKSAASKFWAIGWASLSLALFCLSFGFLHREIAKLLFSFYFFGEYVFCLMLIFGSRALSGDYEFTLRSKLILVPFAVIAAVLGFVLNDFSLIFGLHTLFLGILFGVSFFVLRNLPIKGFGWRIMRVAAALLTLDFFHYLALHVLEKFNIRFTAPEGFQAFNPVIDLVLEVMLSFGMVIILLEHLLLEMKKVNEKLHKAHEKLEQAAHIDPLTTALNRHAFYGFVNKSDVEETKVAGCVGFFDIDDLKPINDRFGHAVGDLAIRAVVSAIRKLIRAEDLIYRWGGDEFFVLLVSMDEEMARERMKNLDRMLTDIRLEGLKQNLTVRVSYGFKDFSGTTELEQAIKAADEEMYRVKQERKKQQKQTSAPLFLSKENIHLSVNP